MKTMSYMLKDRQLQQKLDELTNGEFSKRLNAEPRDAYNSFPVEFRLSPGISLHLYIMQFAIQPIPNYDPSGWNRFPEVTPPEGVWMRVETDVGFGFKARFVRFGDWLNNRNDIIGEKDGIDGTVVRFRPWEDSE